jgi:hypothetical protein
LPVKCVAAIPCLGKKIGCGPESAADLLELLALTESRQVSRHAADGHDRSGRSGRI